RVHRLRHVSAAAAGEPAGPGDHRGREEVRQALTPTLREPGRRAPVTCAAPARPVHGATRQGVTMSPIRRLSRRLLGTFVATAALVAFTGAFPAVAREAPVPLLWKVSDDDNALYLLGSFHLLKPEDYPLSRD